MFAPAILAIQITFFVLLAIAVLLPFLIRRCTKRPFAVSLSTCLIGGLPLLFAIGAVVDSIRYGKFEYEDALKLNDEYVQLPSDSTDIVLHKYASGHELKFKTNHESLQEWMTDWVADVSQYAANVTPFEKDERLTNYKETEFRHRFGQHGWTFPQDAIVYRGWRSGEGSGIDVWFSEVEQTAYISAAYW